MEPHSRLPDSVTFFTYKRTQNIKKPKYKHFITQQTPSHALNSRGGLFKPLETKIYTWNRIQDCQNR